VSWDGTASSAFAGISESDYDQGWYDHQNFLVSASVVANDSCEITASVGSWTLPANYPGAGNKNTVSSSSDFEFRVTGTGDDDMSPANSFDSFQEVTSSAQAIMVSDGVGVSSTTFAGDARVLLSWANDVAGSYSITLTLTIQQLVVP
jgi:hypothetical protein